MESSFFSGSAEHFWPPCCGPAAAPAATPAVGDGHVHDTLQQAALPSVGSAQTGTAQLLDITSGLVCSFCGGVPFPAWPAACLKSLLFPEACRGDQPRGPVMFYPQEESFSDRVHLQTERDRVPGGSWKETSAPCVGASMGRGHIGAALLSTPLQTSFFFF